MIPSEVGGKCAVGRYNKKENDRARFNILECDCSKGHEHLRQPDFCSAVGWVRYCPDRGSRVAGYTLEMGAGTACRAKDYYLGDISSCNDRTVDLDVLMVNSRKPVGICRSRCLDSPGCVQPDKSFSEDQQWPNRLELQRPCL